MVWEMFGAAVGGLVAGGAGAWWACARYSRRQRRVLPRQVAHHADIRSPVSYAIRDVTVRAPHEAGPSSQASAAGMGERAPLGQGGAAAQPMGKIGRDGALTFSDEAMARLTVQARASGIGVGQQIRLLLVQGLLVADEQGVPYKIRWKSQEEAKGPGGDCSES